MDISDIIDADRVAVTENPTSKKRALEQLSELLARDAERLTPTEIFETLIGRERLGSTGLGHGVALPHGRLKSGDHAIGAFIKLSQGVDFDAVDGQPVDLLFALVVPEESTEEHLQILALLAEMFSDADYCRRLRAAASDAVLFDLLTHWKPRRAIA